MFTESSAVKQQTMEQATEHMTKRTMISFSSGLPPTDGGRGISGMIVRYQ